MECKNCKSDEFKKSNIYYEQGIEVEYSLVCIYCENKVAVWSYGYWFESDDEE